MNKWLPIVGAIGTLGLSAGVLLYFKGQPNSPLPTPTPTLEVAVQLTANKQPQIELKFSHGQHYWQNDIFSKTAIRFRILRQIHLSRKNCQCGDGAHPARRLRPVHLYFYVSLHRHPRLLRETLTHKASAFISLDTV